VGLSRRPTAGATRSDDPYLPTHGNGGYRVEHYELDIDYKLAANRLTGRAVLTAVADAPLSRFSLDLTAFRVPRVLVDGKPAKFGQSQSPRGGGKLHVTPARPVTGRFTVEVRYVGNPTPVSSRWGDVGWDELTDGALVASQPIGAPSWFPCNDHPSDKATYRIAVTTAAPYTVAATGVLTARRRSAGTRTWVFERAEPTASYLVSVQIGRYEEVVLAAGPVPQVALLPARLRKNAARDLGRHPAIMTALERFFGPYPFANYQLVVTDDELEAPI
jgi:aminopeptidase N